MRQSASSRPASVEAPLSSLWGWLSPVLLLAGPVQLLTGGREGLWLILLVFVSPLLAFSVARSAPGWSGNRSGEALSALSLVLVVAGVLWANLALASDVAEWLGGPRWSGALLVGGAALAMTTWRGDERAARLLGLVALVALSVPLLAVLGATDPVPPRVWSKVASQSAFRFPADSPWVTEGRRITPRRGVGAVVFEEEHRLVPLAAGPLRVVVSDGTRVRVEELAAVAGRPVVLRPRDRLPLDAEARFRFEGGKRIPGAPVSGIAWADAPLRPRGTALLTFLGAGITLVGGAIALLAFGRSALRSRAAALAGVLLFVAVAWSECWALYTAAYAPEAFLGGVTAEELLELPVLALRGDAWGWELAWLVLVGLLAGFLACASALRRALAPMEEGIARDLWVWGGVLAVAGVASLRPVDPWTLLLLAFGLGASTLAPVAIVGAPGARPEAGTLALGVGLALFGVLAVAGQLAPGGNAILAFPALVAAPVVAGILWLARRLSPEAQ